MRSRTAYLECAEGAIIRRHSNPSRSATVTGREDETYTTYLYEVMYTYIHTHKQRRRRRRVCIADTNTVLDRLSLTRTCAVATKWVLVSSGRTGALVGGRCVLSCHDSPGVDVAVARAVSCPPPPNNNAAMFEGCTRTPTVVENHGKCPGKILRVICTCLCVPFRSRTALGREKKGSVVEWVSGPVLSCRTTKVTTMMMMMRSGYPCRRRWRSSTFFSSSSSLILVF